MLLWPGFVERILRFNRSHFRQVKHMKNILGSLKDSDGSRKILRSKEEAGYEAKRLYK